MKVTQVSPIVNSKNLLIIFTNEGV